MFYFALFRYVERVSEMLRQKLKQADILLLKGATMAEKRQEALDEQSRLEPRIDLLAGRTRELQKLVFDYFLLWRFPRSGCALLCCLLQFKKLLKILSFEL